MFRALTRAGRAPTRDPQSREVDYAHVQSSAAVRISAGRPVVNDFSPSQIRTQGGELVKVFGTNLRSDVQGEQVAIRMRGTPQRLVVATRNEIIFETTEQSQGGDAQVEIDSHMPMYGFKLLVQPMRITAVLPASCCGDAGLVAGATWYIIGENFGNDPSILEASLGDFKVGVLRLVDAHKKIAFEVPPGFGSGIPLVLTKAGEVLKALQGLDFSGLAIRSAHQRGSTLFLQGGPFPTGARADVRIGSSQPVSARITNVGKELTATIPPGSGRGVAIEVYLNDTYRVQVPESVTFNYPENRAATRYVRTVHQALGKRKKK